MKALVFREKFRLAVEEVERPRPGPGEALIEVERSGICGSDLVTYEGKRKVSPPLVLGHEFVGVVRQIEEGGKFFRLGAVQIHYRS